MKLKSVWVMMTVLLIMGSSFLFPKPGLRKKLNPIQPTDHSSYAVSPLGFGQSNPTPGADSVFAYSQAKIVYGRGDVGTSVRGMDIIIVNADGSNPVVLADSPDNEFFVGYADGRVLYYRYSPNMNLCSVKTDGTSKKALTENSLSNRLVKLVGSTVVYGNYNPANNYGSFYSIGIDGTNRRTLATNVTLGDVIGDWMIYEKEASPLNTDLYTVNIKTGTTRVIAAAPESENYGGKHDNWVIFTRDMSNGGNFNRDLYCMPNDSSNDRPTLLAGSPYNETFAGSANDRVFYHLERENSNMDVHSILIDGTWHVTVADSDDAEYFLDTYGYEILIQKNIGALDLFKVSWYGNYETRITNGSLQVDYEDMIGDYVIYRDGYASLTYVFSVRLSGGASLSVAHDVNRFMHEKFNVDQNSRSVIGTQQRGSTGLDCESTSIYGYGMTKFGVTTDDELYVTSTPNSFLFIRYSNGNYNIYSSDFYGFSVIPIATDPNHSEGMPTVIFD